MMWRGVIGMLVMSAVVAADTPEWSQWRGETRDGVVQGVWPESLGDEHLSKRWSVPLEPSYSTPIVKGDLVFTTETRDEAREVVRAFRRENGEQVWEQSWTGAITVPVYAAANGSWIRATPAADEDHLYVAGMRDVLVCLDQQSGQLRWKVDFVGLFKSTLPSFGFVSSPLIDGDSLYVQAAGGLVKIEKATGNVAWRTLADDTVESDSAFSSVVIATLDGVRQLVVQTRSDLVGVDLESGKTLWKQPVEAFREMNILTPLVIGDQIFTSTYGGGSFLFSITQDDGQWQVQQQWRNKVQGYMSTPVVIGEHVYIHLRNGRMACLNLATGQEAWITEPFGKYWSLITNEERILALDERGDLLLIEPDSAEFKLLDRQHISDTTTWAHLVLVGDELYVRALNELVAYRWSQ